MKKIFYATAMLLLATTLVNCKYDKEELLYPQPVACDTTNITFSARVVPVMNAHCLKCHGNTVAGSSGGGLKLQDYNDVKAAIQLVYGSMAHLPGYVPMPKDRSSKIDDCSITTIRIWKDAGAPNN